MSADTTSRQSRRGPLSHRLLLFFLASLLTVLFVWLLGFVLSDIARIPGPQLAEIEKDYVNQEDLDGVEGLKGEREDVRRQMEGLRKVQQILRASTESSRATMEQLIELHRLNLQREIAPKEEDQAALVESQRLFLENQRKFQEANETIATLNNRVDELERDIKTANEEIEVSRKPAREEYYKKDAAHELKLAAFKLAFLIPLFLLSAWLVYKLRGNAFRPIALAAIGATSWKLGRVMHEHFPLGVFKYIAMSAGVLIVLVALVKLIRNIVSPPKDWLLKQYREAYARHRCPICTEPIQRGPLKHATWTRKGPVVAAVRWPSESAEPEDEPYTCPACGHRLFEKCASCGGVRHALLPFCEICGSEKAIAQQPGVSDKAPPADDGKV